MASIQLSINNPCHQNRDDMLPDEQGRFCLSCQKTVVDFTGMTDGQVFDYFKNYKGNTCGQFTPEQLNRNITQPATHSIGRWKYFWQILLPAVFTFYRSEAQPLKGRVSPLTTCKADTGKQKQIVMGGVGIRRPAPNYLLQGNILDTQGTPIPYATIALPNGKGVRAAADGHFSIALHPGEQLTISSIGYIMEKLTWDSIIAKGIQKPEVDKNRNTILITADIRLQQTEALLGEVVVTKRGMTRYGSETGSAVTVARKKNFLFGSKTTKPAADLPALKVFPNPIRPGQSFQIGLQVKKWGNILVRITDASGKMVLEEKLSIADKNQTVTIEGSTLQQPGIYVVSIMNPDGKKDTELNGKLVVQ